MTTAKTVLRWREVGTAAKLVGFASALLIASAYKDARLEVGPLRVHLTVIVLALAALFTSRRAASLPAAIFVPMALFAAVFSVSAIADESISEVIKLLTFFFTIVIVARAIRSAQELLVVALGLLACGAFLELRNFLVVGTAGGAYYDQSLDGLGNKNAFSLYYLPALLFAAWAWLVRPVAGVVRTLVIVAAVFISLTSLMGANRSGWLGVAIVGLAVLSWGRSPRVLIGLTLSASLIYVSFDWVVSADVFRLRLQQTTEGYSSDELRQSLFRTALEIGAENPVLGLGPAGLQRELARRLIPEASYVDPHNAIGAVAGGSGLIALALMAWWLYSLLRLTFGRTMTDARWLLRWLIVLWVARSMFSQETLYSPAFGIAFGAALGYLLSENRMISSTPLLNTRHVTRGAGNRADHVWHRRHHSSW